MEESVKQRLQKKYTIAEARALNPLTLAYIGDGVYSEYIRRFLVSGGISNVNHLTKESIKYVRADGQSKMVLALMHSLTDEEQTIVRRGRNTRSHVPVSYTHLDVYKRQPLGCNTGLFGDHPASGSDSCCFCYNSRGVFPLWA